MTRQGHGRTAEHPPEDDASWARAMKPGAEGILGRVAGPRARTGPNRRRFSEAGRTSALGLVSAGSGPGMIAIVPFFCCA
jgi:hypothetical protein